MRFDAATVSETVAAALTMRRDILRSQIDRQFENELKRSVIPFVESSFRVAEGPEVEAE